ncbi:hypothetical protein [Nitrosococcus oceani]|uniref:hypothetical protein n=1 Tax=Nitrosococcus oceani TaxID=1229 RepID=UPI001FD0DF4F|nr:hypothetical protein [Nitrosococcus oceani]
MNTDTVSFKSPAHYANHQQIDGLDIAMIPIDSPDRSKAIFGTDLKTANILPVHLIVENKGTKEFEINAQQIFGVVANGEMTAAYSLGKSAQHVRRSSIGTTAVTGAVVGAVAGAAVGAGLGAAIGHAAGDSGGGAGAGAAIGGATGAATGAGAGLSDAITIQFKKELASLAFEDRVIYPGDIQQGFIYLKWNPYQKIRVKVFDITDNKTYSLAFKTSIMR